MMRSQPNRRTRSQNNNARNNNQQNLLNKHYESNGSDVKIRGSAQNIVERYTALARDASAIGDHVMAEHYLQHAEHYTRLILAAMAQMQQQNTREERHNNERHNQQKSNETEDKLSSPQAKMPKAQGEIEADLEAKMDEPGSSASPETEDEAQSLRKKIKRNRKKYDRTPGEEPLKSEAATDITEKRAAETPTAVAHEKIKIADEALVEKKPVRKRRTKAEISEDSLKKREKA